METKIDYSKRPNDEFYNNLEAAICRAEQAARKYENIADDGTCNFDSPIIMLPKGTSKKKLAEFDRKVEKLDYGFWKGWYEIHIPLSGQAYRRTKMAEAAAESLKNDGYDAAVYYMMD